VSLFRAPVFDYAGRLSGAICCSVLTIHYSLAGLKTEIGPKVLDCARRISRTMGYEAAVGEA
jgi:DNA-binding IclR family transcriptional regulator